MQTFMFHRVIIDMLSNVMFLIILLFDRTDGETESQRE